MRPLKFYIFYCANSLDINEFNRAFHENEGTEYKKISLPCSGKADFLYLMKAFEKGADGLVLIICEKNKCRYHEGNLRSPKRAEEVNLLLEEIGLGGDRIAILHAEGKDMARIVACVKDFQEKISNDLYQMPDAGASGKNAGTQPATIENN
jgi:coenzyme F420-reducing hydrogenase delta subunit